MGLQSYKVTFKRKGHERDYDAYWLRGETKSAAGKTLQTDIIGFVDFFDAKNSADATQLARRKYPQDTIDSVVRIG